jgi:hypothetical protein
MSFYYNKNKNKLFCFPHIPKTASSAIHKYFTSNGFIDIAYDDKFPNIGRDVSKFNTNYYPHGNQSLQHITSFQFLKLKSDILKIIDDSVEIYDFTIFRNPIDRFISEFNFLKKNFNKLNVNDIYEFWELVYKYIQDGQINILDNHIIPQFNFLYSGIVVVNYSNISEIFKYFDLEGHLEIVNDSKIHNDISTIFIPDSKFTQFYKKDIFIYNKLEHNPITKIEII